MREQTCMERIKQEYADEMDSLRKLWEVWQDDPEAYTDEEDRLDEHGLWFDYVAPEDQQEGYFRWAFQQEDQVMNFVSLSILISQSTPSNTGS